MSHVMKWPMFSPLMISTAIHVILMAIVYGIGLSQQLKHVDTSAPPIAVEYMGEVEPSQSFPLSKKFQDLGQQTGVVVTKKPIKNLRLGLGKLLKKSQDFVINKDFKSSKDKVAEGGFDQGQNDGDIVAVSGKITEAMLKEKGSGGDQFKFLTQMPQGNSNINWQKIEYTKLPETSNSPHVDSQEIIRKLATKELAVRDCYESAILYYTQLSGYLQFNLLVGNSGRVQQTRIQFKGDSTPKSLSVLKSCLEREYGSLVFNKELSGKQIRWGIRTRS